MTQNRGDQQRDEPVEPTVNPVTESGEVPDTVDQTPPDGTDNPFADTPSIEVMSAIDAAAPDAAATDLMVLVDEHRGDASPEQVDDQPDATFADSAVALGGDVVAWFKDNSAVICLAFTLAGIAIFTMVFGSLAVDNHRNFGTWAYDAAIYDQAIWLVSRGQQTFMTVRGMDVWGHHVNLVFYLFAPFYRLGAGPELLYVVQNFTIALAALPVYLIAKDRFRQPSIGLVFAIAYLMYAPIQWISWINFHPEAMVIAPFMFAWYFASRKRWRWFVVSVFFVLIMREDAALAIIMLGVVLLITSWRSVTRRQDAQIALATFALGVVWYALATQVVIPHFNNGGSAFYLKYFFSEWGGSISGIAENVVRHPDRVISAAMQGDRTRFYRQLGLPLGGFAILSPLHLLMAAPQMLASVIGGQPYARSIMYQYPSIMIAPIMIASVEGAHFLWRRFRFMRWGLYVWLLAAAYLSNVAWSNSPIGNYYGTWIRDNPRIDTLRAAIDMVPDDAVVSSSYSLGPHLSHRDGSYDWPNPFYPAYWGNEVPLAPDCTRFPSASVVDYLVLDLNLYALGDPNRTFIDALISEDQFEAVFEKDNVLVARRLTPGPDGRDVPINCPVVSGQGHLSALEFIGAEPEPIPITPTPTAPIPTFPQTTQSPSTPAPTDPTATTEASPTTEAPGGSSP